jgi:hypothetical protein
MKNILKMLFGGDFQAGVYENGGKVDTKLSIAEVEKIAKATANALGSDFSVTKGSVDTGTFDLDYMGEKYDGGSYLIMDNGDVVNVALRKSEVYYNYKTKKKANLDFKGGYNYEAGGDFQSGVYAEGGSLEAHGINVGDTFLKTMSGVIQKVKDKNGNIVYVNLATGERKSQLPLPFDDGGEVMYFINKDGIKVRSKVEPKEKLSEAEWMAKHNDSKEARTYGFGGLFGKAKEIVKPTKYPQLEGKQVVLKSGEYVQVLTQDESSLMVMELNKIGTGVKPRKVTIYDVDMTSFANGGALIGNQKRIDMNKNGKIDAEDFKLLRSSMNGAWRNERKHVNHNEDYEVRYAKKKPARTGYKGKRKFGEGGGISNFERLSRVVAKNYEGKRVKPQYQKEYGKVYSKSEAKEVGNKVAGKVKAMQKAESGTSVKKETRGGVMVLAKKIRKDGESWKDALKRAGQQLK